MVTFAVPVISRLSREGIVGTQTTACLKRAEICNHSDKNTKCCRPPALLMRVPLLYVLPCCRFRNGYMNGYDPRLRQRLRNGYINGYTNDYVYAHVNDYFNGFIDGYVNVYINGARQRGHQRLR